MLNTLSRSAILFALALALPGCPAGDNTHPDATTDVLRVGWRSCSDPFTPGDDCRKVCCEYEDWFSRNVDDAGTLEVYCMNTKRICTAP